MLKTISFDTIPTKKKDIEKNVVNAAALNQVIHYFLQKILAKIIFTLSVKIVKITIVKNRKEE